MEEPKKRILVVDDSEYNVEVISSHLTAEGYEVVSAYDGESAIRIVKESLPDLILLDVMMPVMDGYEVCRRVKEMENTRFVPVILITALSNPDDKVRGFEAGADDFLVKPLNSIEMLARIKNLLRSRDLVEKQRRRDQYEAELSKELDLREIRIEEEAKRKQFYKEVIYSVTNGKLRLMERIELTALTGGEEPVGGMQVIKAEDVAKARHLVEAEAKRAGMVRDKVYDLTLCVSEAATNVIKHGENGQMHVTIRDSVFRIWLQDSGPGIEFTNLPKATLMRGFSTKSSFGYGFKIMLDLLDALYLCTDRDGTTLLLEMSLKPPVTEASELDQFLKSWEAS